MVLTCPNFRTVILQLIQQRLFAELIGDPSFVRGS